MRVGIFGGTFDPPHKGHAEALKRFILSAGLERVFVIPTFMPPHKELPEGCADFEDRLSMCKIAFSCSTSLCDVVFSDIERVLFLESGEKNYTFKTLERLKKDSHDTFCLYVGTDMLLTFKNWKNSEYLLKNAELWVMPREDEPFSASSTIVRAGSFTLVDERVREYIVSRGLYE